MCRNIRNLFNFEPPATPEEIHNASLQFVRKISGFTKPSAANEEAFNHAVDQVSQITNELLKNLVTNAPHKDRAIEKQHAQQRNAKRFKTQ